MKNFKIGDKVQLTSNKTGYSRGELIEHFNDTLKKGDILTISSEPKKYYESDFCYFTFPNMNTRGGCDLYIMETELEYAYVVETPLYKAIYGVK